MIVASALSSIGVLGAEQDPTRGPGIPRPKTRVETRTVPPVEPGIYPDGQREHLLFPDELRRLDGTGNHPDHSEWGSAELPFLRLAPNTQKQTRLYWKSEQDTCVISITDW